MTYPGMVYQGDQPMPANVVVVHEEWAEGEATLQTPALVILDAVGAYESGGFAPHVDEESAWPATDGALERVALRHESEYVVTFQVLCQATDRALRRALIRGVREALSGALDYSPANDDRYGVLLDTGDLYYGLKGRFAPSRMQRTDTADAAGQRHRAATVFVDASIPVVTPVVLPVLTELRHEEEED